MIDKLISEGEQLKTEIKQGSLGRTISGENFEKWASKVVLYFEDNFPNNSLTEKAKQVYSRLSTKSVSNYEFLLGTLKGIKEYQDEESDGWEI